MYNYKWQEIINSLLQTDYDKRMDIDEVYEIISNEINIKDLENKMDKLNINNKKSKIPLNDKNIITGEIDINKNNINKDVQIINSFENVKREYDWGNKNDDWKYENEKELKENVEIKINGKTIKFEYHLKFEKEGKYKIEYLFKKNLTKTDYMFYDCKSLQNLDLSNFNSQNVTSMSNMFCGCKSLTNLNLSNFYTQNVTNMSGMFDGCKKLKNLDLSNFDTQNVTDMSNMLNDCDSLTQDNINTKDNKILEEFKKLNDI
jgi:surface protein